MTELIKIRIDILKQMHNYIIEMGDDEIYLDWVTLAIPDEPTEEDFFDCAMDNSCWLEIIEIFRKLAFYG